MADKASVMKLREQTGAGILECKNALDEVNDDYDKALEIIKKKRFCKSFQERTKNNCRRQNRFLHSY